MNFMNLKYFSTLVLVCTPIWAQPVVAASAASRPTPTLERLVIEDGGARIEELRVRGQTQRIVVTPKVGLNRSYEILTGSAAQDTFEGTGGARSSAGKRVWNVLEF
jgi:hypothetical protein